MLKKRPGAQEREEGIGARRWPEERADRLQSVGGRGVVRNRYITKGAGFPVSKEGASDAVQEKTRGTPGALDQKKRYFNRRFRFSVEKQKSNCAGMPGCMWTHAPNADLTHTPT